MANPKRGEIDIVLGGETRVLKADFESMARADQMLGQSVLQALAQGNIGARTLAICFTCFLRHEDRKITTKKVLKMMDSQHFEYYQEKFVDVLEAGGWIKLDEDEGEEGDGGDQPLAAETEDEDGEGPIDLAAGD